MGDERKRNVRVGGVEADKYPRSEGLLAVTKELPSQWDGQEEVDISGQALPVDTCQVNKTRVKKLVYIRSKKSMQCLET